MHYNVTPELITKLEPNQVFVFGSNLHGIHGSGAAKDALKFGAKHGSGVGYFGQTYAIPTVSTVHYPNRASMTLEEIRPFVESFLVFAKHHQELQFLVTPIGCGLAGFKVKDIAPMFASAVLLQNVSLPKSFLEYLNDQWNLIGKPLI